MSPPPAGSGGGRFRTMADFWSYVAGVTDYEKKTDYRVDRKTFSLDRMRALAERIGRPDERYAILHVAGSNGKGTVSHLAAEILRRAGQRVGLYTSPHLARVTERVRVDGEAIPEAEWLDAFERLHDAFEAPHPDGRPTFFEMTTAVALDVFARRGVDFAVLEVGLGGRLDATNVVRPVATAITEISLEHTVQLGDTIPAIAAEKAAILKEGVPAICGVSDPAAREVIEARALAEAAPLFLYGSDLVVDPIEVVPERGTRFHVRTWKRGYSGLFLAMPGNQFVRDAAIALGLCEAAKEQGLVDFGSAHLRPALAESRVPGRCHRVEPSVLLDGAHNPGAMAAVFDALATHFPGRRPVVLLGMLADKDAGATLAAMRGVVRFHVTEVESPRTRPAEDLAAAVRAAVGPGVEVDVDPDAVRLLDAARARLAPDELLVVTGSFYLVGRLLRERYPEQA